MRIRKALDKDGIAIQALVFAVLEEYGLTPDPNGMDQDLGTIERTYHRDRGYFAVAESKKRIIGSVGIYKIDTATCELRKMYMLEDFRGKGLGKLLLDFSLGKARTLGYKRMILETASVLTEAIALYKKYGFKVYQPEHLSFRCNMAMELVL